jgi:hypothetical protein
VLKAPHKYKIRNKWKGIVTGQTRKLGAYLGVGHREGVVRLLLPWVLRSSSLFFISVERIKEQNLSGEHGSRLGNAPQSEEYLLSTSRESPYFIYSIFGSRFTLI